MNRLHSVLLENPDIPAVFNLLHGFGTGFVILPVFRIFHFYDTSRFCRQEKGFWSVKPFIVKPFVYTRLQFAAGQTVKCNYTLTKCSTLLI